MFSSASSQGRLTIDAVQTIMSNSMLPGQHLTIQLLQTQTNYLGYYYSELSDGYSKIKCELRQRIKLMVEQEQIKEFSVISCGKDDIEVTCEDERVEVVVKNCTVVSAQVSKMIGQPMPCNLYKANNYQNPNGNNEIDTTPKHYTIREIVNNTRLRNAHLKARVTKLPDNIGKNILCFLLQDEQERQIQCVCYDQVAEELFLQLKLGSQYLFTGFVLQKNKKNNDDELRFRKESKVLLLNGGKVVSSNVSSNGNENSNKQPNGAIKQPIKQQRVQQIKNQIESNSNQPPSDQNPTPISNKRDIISHLSSSQSQQNTLFTLQGRVTFLIQKPKYRKVNIHDDRDDVIDLMLWQQVKQPIQLQKSYSFTLMKIKYTPQVRQGNYRYVELHSTKKTKITQINAQQMQESNKRSFANGNNNNNNNNYRPKHQQQQQQRQRQLNDKNEHKQTTKKLPDHIILNKLSDLLDIKQHGQQAKQKLASPYPFVQCTLKFRTQGFMYNKSEDEILNYFSFYCGSCNKSTTTILSENNVVSCNRCKRDDVMVKWSLRVKALDFNFELPCSLQSETTQRLLNMKAFDGYVLYHRQFSKFQTLVHKVNFQRRICKFQIREKQGSQYYNVLQVYAKETKSQVYNAMARLKERIKQCQPRNVQQQQIKNQSVEE